MIEAIKVTQRADLEITPHPMEEATDFQFHDLNPNDSLKSDVKGLIRRIYEHTPDGSVIVGTLKKVKSGYKGALKIVHQGGQMIVESIQKTTDGTLEVLENQIWNKIRRWRKTRFRDDEAEELSTP